mgnify:FL=1
MCELCAAVCKASGLRAYARGYAYLRLSAQIQLRFGASYVPPSASIRLARIRSRLRLFAPVGANTAPLMRLGGASTKQNSIPL